MAHNYFEMQMTVRAPVPYSWLSNLFICNLAEETGTAFIWSSTSSSEMATDTDKSGLELGKGLFDLPSFQLSKLEGDGPKDQRCTQPWCHILGNLSTSFFGHSGRFMEVRLRSDQFHMLRKVPSSIYGTSNRRTRSSDRAASRRPRRSPMTSESSSGTSITYVPMSL